MSGATTSPTTETCRATGTAPEPEMEALMALVERAVGGPELPDYAGVPDSGPTGQLG